MNNSGRTIAKNASILLVSQVITWALAFVMAIYLPRYLGALALGKFHLASSIWVIVSMIAGFGMDTLMTKEIARAPARMMELLSVNMLIRTLLYVLGSVIVSLYVYLVGYPLETIYVIVITGLVTLVLNWVSACEACLVGLEKMEFLSLGKIIGKVILAGLSLGALFLGYGVMVIASVGFVAYSINLLILLSIINNIQPFKFSLNRQLGIWMLKAGVPYLLVYGFLVLYQQIDVILLSLLANESSIGWYGTAEQLFGALLFIPSAFITAIFPVLSRLFASAPDSLTKIMQKSSFFLLLLSMPIGLGIVIVANPAVILLFGPEFANTGPVLMVLGFVLVFTYQNTLLGQYLISSDRQNKWTWVMAVGSLVTIPLDLALISWCQATFNNGAMGAALAFFFTELGMMVYGFRFLPEGTLNRSSAWQAIRILFAGIGMFGITWWFRQSFILVPLIIGAVSYTGLILIFKVIPPEDFDVLKSMAQNVTHRFIKRKVQPANAGGKS